MDLWLTAIGRLHPALLHFPLALGATAALVELWSWVRRRPAPSSTAFVLWWLAVASAPLAIISGTLLASGSGDEGLQLELHRWSGIGASVGLLMLAVTATFIRGRAPGRAGTVYRLGAVLVAGVLAWCGHLGGEMKWGQGFTTSALLEALRATFAPSAGAGPAAIDPAAGPGRAPPSSRSGEPAELPNASVPGTPNTPNTPKPEAPDGPDAPSPGGQNTPVLETVLFDLHIHPMLVDHCAECHLGGRRKGRLALGDVQSIVRQNGDGLWIIKAGAPEESELLRRVMLPDGDEMAMPPEGPRLSEREIEVLRRWIESGAR